MRQNAAANRAKFAACAWRALRAGLLCLASAASAQQDFTIGVIAGLTGAGASYGKGIVQGARMAVQDVNAAGGVNGRKLVLKIVDDASEPARSAIVMRRLLATSPDLIVGGWGSSQVLAHLELAEQSAIPYIVVGATNPGISRRDNAWIFRVIPSDTIMARQLAIVATTDLAMKRIAVIYDGNAYGTGSRDVFVAALAQGGIQPVEVRGYQTGDTDFRHQLTAIKAARPEALAIFGTMPAAPRIMQAARELGITARFLGTGGLANEQLLQAAPGVAEGTILMTQFHEDTDPAAKAWAERYQRTFDDKQFVNAAWEYRAIHDIAVPCLRHAGRDRIVLRNCIATWRGRLFDSPADTGFDATGQLLHPPAVVQVSGGVFKLLRNGR